MQTTKVTSGGTAIFGTRTSAEGRPLLDQARRERCFMTHITQKRPGNRVGLASLVTVQVGNGWRWRRRHNQGIRQRRAGAHDID